jgi:NAD(P)H-hydrate epimerase
MQKTTSLLIGPGLGQEGTTLNFLRKMFQGNLYSKSDSRIGFAQHVQHDINPIKSHLPSSIIDADALKLLAKIENWPGLLPENSLLTPHPGEMSTLSGLSVSDIQQNRMAVARKYSQEWNITLVLKGALSIIASPDGRVTVIPIATSALAKAGTGDALAGMIAGFLAQGLSPYDAAVTGSWFHAKAGQIAEKRVGCSASVQAMDVVNSISAALSLDNFSGN